MFEQSSYFEHRTAVGSSQVFYVVVAWQPQAAKPPQHKMGESPQATRSPE